MEKILELDRIIYKFGEDREDKLLMIQELINGVAVWKPISKCWEYSLWYGIGERGGLAEAGELLILEDNKEKKIKIEDYISIYRKEIDTNQLPIEEIFKKFKIKAIAWKSKSLDDYDQKYMSKQFRDDYELTQVKEDDFKIYYEGVVTSEEVLSKIPLEYIKENRWEIKLIFESI